MLNKLVKYSKLWTSKSVNIFRSVQHKLSFRHSAMGGKSIIAKNYPFNVQPSFWHSLIPDGFLFFFGYRRWPAFIKTEQFNIKDLYLYEPLLDDNAVNAEFHQEKILQNSRKKTEKLVLNHFQLKRSPFFTFVYGKEPSWWLNALSLKRYQFSPIQPI